MTGPSGSSTRKRKKRKRDREKFKTSVHGDAAFCSSFAGAALPQRAQAGRGSHAARPAAGTGKKLNPSPVKQWALENEIALYQPARLKESSFLRELETVAPDLIAVVAYGLLLPPELLKLPPLGCINLHASLLPAYRGAAPIERAVMDGARETGVTVMFMAEELDVGDIILQERQPISFTDTSGELGARLAAAGARLLRRAADEIAAGKARRIPQDHSRASYAPPLRPR